MSSHIFVNNLFLTARGVKTTCPLQMPTTTYKEMFKVRFSEGESHKENCLSSAKLGYGAGH